MGTEEKVDVERKSPARPQPGTAASDPQQAVSLSMQTSREPSLLFEGTFSGYNNNLNPTVNHRAMGGSQRLLPDKRGLPRPPHTERGRTAPTELADRRLAFHRVGGLPPFPRGRLWASAPASLVVAWLVVTSSRD